MAGTIGLNQVYFVARIASMKSAAENINITAESWSSMGKRRMLLNSMWRSTDSCRQSCRAIGAFC